MLVLVFLLVIGLALASYGLFFSDSGASSRKPLKNKVFLPQAGADDQIKEKNLKLRQELDVLNIEFEKLKAVNLELKSQIEAWQKKESDLKEELVKRNGWVAKNDEILNKAKAGVGDFEKKLAAKGKELEEEFSKNVNLTRQLNEAVEKIAPLEKTRKDLTEQIQSLLAQVERLTKESAMVTTQLKTQESAVSQMKQKEEQSEWVSKKDFNKLNDEYSRLEEELEEKEKRVRSLTEELIKVKNPLP